MVDLYIGATILNIYAPVLDYVTNNPQGDMGQYMKKRGRLMMAMAKRQAPKNTGRLARSIGMIHSREARGQYMTIGSDVRYAEAVHTGTAPHEITPQQAGILRFSAGGRVIYSHHVQHPGTRANHYLSDQLWMIRI